ncbi:MAG: SRPBCC family protein [Flavobacteriales bacterium]|nr:SRPBCC family protein [Flavobacteriales bacterium]MBK7268797.1 SRPBCC family protein [Flavobacteriales bacterium]
MSTKVKITPHGERAILITRSFKAPRELVFAAMSQAEMVSQWLHGPPGWTMTTSEMDLRVGGRYRWVWTNADGREMGMGGTVLDVDPPSLLKTTEQFDDAWYEGEATNTGTLTEENGVTLMSLVVEYESTKARDGVLAGPMASGLDASYDHLDNFLNAKH